VTPPPGRDRRGRDRTPPPGAPKERRDWGSVARKGARNLGEPRPGAASASKEWRDAVDRARGGSPDRSGQPWEPDEVWVDEGTAGPPARKPRRPPRAPSPAEPPRTGRPRRTVPPAVVNELTDAAGTGRGPKLAERLAEAAKAYERDRYQDAHRILKVLADRAPHAATVRELYGLTLYREGRWADAIRELEAFGSMTGSSDQVPVLADCHRALRHWDKVAELWDELRKASPGAEVTAEGRIVAAGALADQGDVQGAIRLLERAPLDVRRPKPHHLRLWYALADLYERAGDIPRARQLFHRILEHDPDAFDVPQRVRALA
jgi:thioredoxin-like negative regulator of GroEL